MAWNNAKIDMTDAVKLMAIDETVALYVHTDPGMYIGGRFVQPTAVTTGITASVQPGSGNGEELMRLPEAMRTREVIDVWATSALVPLARNSGRPPDLVQWRGKSFSVERVENFSENGRYWYAFCVAVDQ